MDSSDCDDLFITQSTFNNNAFDNTVDLEGNIIDLMSILENDKINVSSYNDEANQKYDSNSDTFSDCDNNILIQATQEAEKQIVPHYSDISDEEETSDTKRFQFIPDENLGFFATKM